MQIIAHRGGLPSSLENSLLSINYLLEIGANGLEIDIQETLDNEFIVIHDQTVDRTTNGSGRVDQLKLVQIQQLSLGGFHFVPTLEQFLHRWVKLRDKLKLFVELKQIKSIDKLIYVLERYKGQGLYIKSPNPLILNRIEISKVAIPVLLIEHLDFLEEVISDKKFYPVISLRSALICKRVVDHFQDVELFVWTVNNKKEAKRVNKFGVTYLCTDFPYLGLSWI